LSVLDVTTRPFRWGPARRLVPSLLRENVPFRRFFAGKFVSLVGDQV